MSDLSWLNPTPHAIAVYASQPLSPVATQHSLPSGRYSLLGPDLHRLDRTSFAWRTHSITSSARASSVCRISSPSTLAVLASERNRVMKPRRFNRSNCIRSLLVGRIGGSSRPHWRIGLAKVSQGYGTTLTACQPRKNACRDPGAPPAAPCRLAG